MYPRSSKLIPHTALLAFFVSAMSWAMPATSPTGIQLKVALALDSPSVSLHEPVQFTLTFSNESKDTIALDLGKDFQLGLEVRIASGPDDLRKVRLPVSDGLGDPGHLTVLPKHAVTKRFLLDDWFKPEGPGEYEISLEVQVQPRTASGRDVLLVQPEPTTLTVSPREPERLRQKCRELAERAIKTPNAGEGFWASRQLSLVRDPEAIPFLEAVLTQSYYGRMNAILGLQRVGGEAATDVFIRYLVKQNQPFQSSVVSILFMTRMASGDQELRERIWKAISPYLKEPNSQ